MLLSFTHQLNFLVNQKMFKYLDLKV